MAQTVTKEMVKEAIGDQFKDWSINLSQKSMTDLADFYGNTLPEAIGESRAAFNKYMADVLTGHAGFLDLRESVLKSVQDPFRGLTRSAAAGGSSLLWGGLSNLFSKDDDDEDWTFSGMPEEITKELEAQATLTDKKFGAFFSRSIPAALGVTSDAFADMVTGIAFGTQQASTLFSDMETTLKRVANNILAQLMDMSIQFMLFGSQKGGRGGLVGGLVDLVGSGLGALFGGGGIPAGASALNGQLSTGNGGFRGPGFSAKGNVFPAGTGLSAYCNSIVSSPTAFLYGKGGVPNLGIMGEAGAEAIMPLTRMASGDLGVRANVERGQAPQVNVIVNTPPGVAVTEQKQSQNNQGGFDMTLLLEMVDKAMAGGISSGRSKTAQAMSMRGSYA